jgi:hypothetical protein
LSGGEELEVSGGLDYAVMTPWPAQDTTHARLPILAQVSSVGYTYISMIDLSVHGGQYLASVGKTIVTRGGETISRTDTLSGTVYRKGSIIVFDGGTIEEGYGVLEGNQLRVFDIWAGVFGCCDVQPRLTGVFTLAP